MPGIRDLGDQQFQNLLSQEPLQLNTAYDNMTCSEQQDFILRTLRETHPALKNLGLSLDDLKSIVKNVQFGTQNLWNGIRTYLTASDIRQNASQLAVALFGDYLESLRAYYQSTGLEFPLEQTRQDVDLNYSYAEELVARAKRAEQLNFIQVTDDPPIFVQNEPMLPETYTVTGVSAPPKDDDLITDMFAYEVQTDPISGIVLHNGIPQPIGKTLTDDIVSTGNLKVLENFRKQNRDKLNKREKAYLSRRIRSAREINKLEKKALMRIAYGDPPEFDKSMEVIEDKDGFIGFPGLKLLESQSSHNGCWSCSYSLLLKSRSVTMSQENIRGFRVDLGNDPKEQIKVTNDYRKRMNNDEVNNLYENGDLLLKVLPNTAMNQFTINPMVDMPLSLKEKDKPARPLTKEEAQIFEQYYITQTREKLHDIIINALTVDRSPIAINWGGHYVTITGISQDGKIRVEDSARSKADNPTQILDLTDVINESLYGKKGQERVTATGLSLCWLKDLTPPEYGKVSPDNNQLYDEPDVVTIEKDGQIKFNIAGKNNLSLSGNPAAGQGAGNTLSRLQFMDQKDMPALLGGNIEGFGSVDGTFMIGTMETYYPKKMQLLRDPVLEQYKFNTGDQTIQELRGLMESSLYTLHFDQNISFDPIFRKYINALEELNYDHDPEDKEQIDEALDTLRELHDVFRREYTDGRTYYQVLEEGLQLKNRERFHELWNKLDRTSKLGINAKEILFDPENIRRFNEGLPAMDIEPAAPYLNYLYRQWRQVEQEIVNPENNRDSIAEHLSVIIAAEELWTEAIENNKGKKNTRVDEAAIKKNAEQIRQSRAFMKLIEKNKYIDLAKQGSSVDLVNAYRNAERKMGDRSEATVNDYILKEQDYRKKGQQLKTIYRQLRNTRTGSYLGLGIISRRHNSAAYENAFKALQSLKNGMYGQKYAAKRYEACQIIKDYLEGKEKERGRSFGKERWKGFMSALALCMPRKEFEEYCDHINQVRGVSGQPDNKDFIGPENFYDKNATMDIMMQDTMDRIKDGNATTRDYARAVAIRELQSQNRGSVTRAELRKRTDHMLENPQFKEFMTSRQKPEIEKAIEKKSFCLS